MIIPSAPDDSGGDRSSSASVAFVSDLHLFSSRCDYDRHAAAVGRAIEGSDICVWGGDLFDFCWSQVGDLERSRRQAVEWLEHWRKRFPDKVFVYLNGNHDAQEAFQEDLRNWASRANPHAGESLVVGGDGSPDRLVARPGSVHVGWDAIRLADTVLVHGDVIVGGGSAEALATYRSRWEHGPKAEHGVKGVKGERAAQESARRFAGSGPALRREPANGKLRNGLYDAAVATRLHLAAAGVAHRRRNVCLRLLRWIRDQPGWLHQDVGRVVFGHTHRRMHGVEVGGTLFFNGGAAVRHVPFDPVVITVGQHHR